MAPVVSGVLVNSSLLLTIGNNGIWADSPGFRPKRFLLGILPNLEVSVQILGRSGLISNKPRRGDVA